MIDLARLEEIVRDVTAWDRKILVFERSGELWIQLEHYTDGGIHRTRKWMVSRHATKSEVVQTLLKALLTSLEHEAREHFLYRGKKVYGPHFDVDELHAIAERVDRRDPPKGT